MKVKVTKVPSKNNSSEKSMKVKVKTVPEGLPKADIGKRMAKKKADRMQSAWDKGIAEYQKSIAYPAEQILGTNQYGADDSFYQEQPNPDNIPYNQENDLDNAFYKGQSNVNSIPYTQEIGLDNTYYSGADPYVENPKYSDSKSVKNKKGLKNKKRANWDFSNFNVYLPGLNPKYNYLTNKLIGEIGNAKSIFKTGAPMKNQNYLGYNPYYSPFMYAEGGYLPKYVEAGITGFMNEYPRSNDEDNLDKEPEGLTDISPAYDPFKNMSFEQTMGTLGAELPKEPNNPMLEKSLKKYQKNQKTLKRIKRMGAIGAPLSTLGTIGMEATGDVLSFIGDKRQSDQFNAMNAQIRAQAPMANVQPTTLPTSFQGDNPLATGAYGGRIKRYAADGMQIKQIGGMGEPNVEVEGEEHIQLPNGFSQEIKGKKHSEGGIPINLPSGTKIFSEKLKVPVKFIQELISVNPEYAFLKNISLPKSGNISYADLAKKFETKKYVDMLNSKDADPIQITTAQLMIQQNNAFLEKLFTLQEQNKISGVHGPQVQQNAQQEQQEQEAQQAQMQGEQMEQPMMKYGGLYKAQDGKIAPNSSKVKSINTMYNSNETINGKPKSLGSFENYSTVINSYPNMPNDTSYMYTQSNTPGKYEEFFYNTNQGKPIVQMRKGQDFIKLSPEETMGYKNKVLTGVGGFKYGGYHLPKAVDGKTNFPFSKNKKYWNTGYNYLDDIKLKKAFPQYKERGEEFFDPFSAALESGNLMLNPIVNKWVIKGQGLTKEGTYGDINEEDVRNLENAPGFKFMKSIAEKYGKKHFDPTDTKMVRDYEDIVNATYEAEGLPVYFQNLTDPTKPFSKEQKFGNWHASVAPIIRKSIGAGTTADSDTEAVRYVVEKEPVKKTEEQEADAMRGKTSFVPSEGSAATKGIPFNLGIGKPIPQIDSVYAGDYYKLEPQLEFLKRVTPDYNPATRAMRAMVTNDTDLSGVGIANRQNAYANFLNQMGDIQNQANLQNIGIEQQEKFGNRASIEQADRINLQGYQNYMADYLKALGAKGTQEGLRKEAEKNYFSNAIKEANTINALQQAYFPGQYAQGTLGDVLETNPVVKYGGKVKKKVKIKPKLKNSYF